MSAKKLDVPVVPESQATPEEEAFDAELAGEEPGSESNEPQEADWNITEDQELKGIEDDLPIITAKEKAALVPDTSKKNDTSSKAQVEGAIKASQLEAQSSPLVEATTKSPSLVEAVLNKPKTKVPKAQPKAANITPSTGGLPLVGSYINPKSGAIDTSKLEASATPPAGTQTGQGQGTPPADDEGKGKSKSKTPRWMLDSLMGRLMENSGRGLGRISRGIGDIIGEGAKAVGNMGAAMNMSGAEQQAAYGNAPGAGAAALAQGLGNTAAVGASALGDMVGGSAEDLFTELGATQRDYAAHKELQAIEKEMYDELQRQIDWAHAHGVPLDKAGIYEVYKNIHNSAGNVMTSMNRVRAAGQTQAGLRNGGMRP
jgi:hypothetical protein